MKITNGSIELHVAEDGDPSAPPILLLHGITASTRSWDWIVPMLSGRFRVLRLDFRGHGDSDRAEGHYDLEGYTSDAVAAIEQAAGRPCVVVGHSLGGATAAALAQHHAPLVVAAVMEDPPLGVAGPAAPRNASSAPLLEGNSLLESFQVIRNSAPRLQAAGLSVETLAGVLAAAPTAAGPPFAEVLHFDAVTSMAASLLSVDASVLDPVLTGSIGSFLDIDAPFQVPSLIVCADPASVDAVADPARAEQFAAISPMTEFVVLDGAGHLMHDELTSRDRFLAATLDFLDRVVGD